MIKELFSKLLRRPPAPARDTLEELIEEEESSIDPEERLLLSNILDLRDQNASDVIIPRGDLKAVSIEAPFEEVASAISASPFTRILVYEGNLDTIVGFVHIKDILKFVSDFSCFDLKSILQRILFVSPSLPLLDLLLQMRMTKIPLAVVVDEYGATDGLVAAWDIIREILGDIGDIHDMESAPKITRISDSSVLVDGRLDLEDLEEALGSFRTQEDREEDVETVGGFVLYLAGRVPAVKEVIEHKSGTVFEIVDADPRRVKKARVYKILEEALVSRKKTVNSEPQDPS
ncbi:MAG: CBS domain-containing protein [bacterium]|nr:CBS domain-containing protein [bacterium]